MTVKGAPVGTTYHLSSGMSSVLIIGSGNFGAATALSLARKGGVQVTLVDTTEYPNPRAASHDINKIVRDDYPDTMYMKMMLRAMPMWRSDELYQPWYHEVGMLRADATDFGPRSMAAYEALGSTSGSSYLPVDEVRRRWKGVFATSNFDGVDQVIYNPNVGYAEADKALGAVIQAAVDLGVTYVTGEMASLAFGPEGSHAGANTTCIGVNLVDGRRLTADKVMLATGARTAHLLAQSAPGNKDIHAGDRLLSTGAVSFYAKVHGAQREKLRNMPVLKSCLPHVKGEGMSMLDDGTIKFNCDLCFTNYRDWPFTEEPMSITPDISTYNVWTGPKFLEFFEERARQTIDGLYGDEVKDIQIDSYRMCWYVTLSHLTLTLSGQY